MSYLGGLWDKRFFGGIVESRSLPRNPLRYQSSKDFREEKSYVHYDFLLKFRSRMKILENLQKFFSGKYLPYLDLSKIYREILCGLFSYKHPRHMSLK